MREFSVQLSCLCVCLVTAMGETGGETRDGQVGDKVLEHLYKVLVIGDFGVGTFVTQGLGSCVVRAAAVELITCKVNLVLRSIVVSDRVADVVLFVSDSLL